MLLGYWAVGMNRVAALTVKWSEKPSAVGTQDRAFLKNGFHCPWGEVDRETPRLPES